MPNTDGGVSEVYFPLMLTRADAERLLRWMQYADVRSNDDWMVQGRIELRLKVLLGVQTEAEKIGGEAMESAKNDAIASEQSEQRG